MSSNKYPDPIGEGAMWEKTYGDGKILLSGTLEFPPATGAPPVKVQFAAFPQENKKTDRSPDYRIIVNSCEPAPARAARGARNAPQAPRGAPPQESDDDIPF
jgi:uncharacterized protein (DUF736 family)